MSFQAMTWATEQELKYADKIVLVMLANRCNHDTGRCDPSHKRLAKECGMSLSTLKRSIERLAAEGLLTIEPREVNGVSLPNQYHLHLEVSSQRTPSVQKAKGVGSRKGGGVGSDGPEGWGHSELQNSNYNQEVKPGSKPITVSDKSVPVPGGVLVGEVLPKSKHEDGKSEQETEVQRKCREAWVAYKNAYHHRYGTDPIRNAKINALVKQLVQRLGSESSGVAEYFVRNVNEAFVVRQMHDLGLLVGKAEMYRTQWATGQSMTNTRAQQIDQSQANYNAADEAKAMLRAKRAGGSNAN